MLRFTKNKRLLKVSISLCLGLVFSLANCSPARAVDGLFNGKFLTGENDDFVLWLQSYDQANSPYYNDLFFLNKAGNVGIGITNPAAKLQINPGTNTEGLRIITSNYSPFVIRNASDTADIFRIDQNGNITGGIGNSSAWTRNNATSQLYVSNVNDNVGIGTSNPGSKFVVITTNTGQPVLGSFAGTGLSVLGGGGNYGLVTGVSGNGDSWLQGQRVDGTATAYDILLNPSGGNVGIGTTNPGAKLTVDGKIQGTSLALFQATNDINGGMLFYATDGNGGGIFREIGGNGNLVFRNQGINTAYINNGNVGIGTAAPSQKLDVQGNIAIANNMIGGGKNYGNSGNSASAYLQLYDNSTGRTTLNNQVYAIDFQTATTSRLFITNGGNVGIGTTTPQVALDVNGLIKMRASNITTTSDVINKGYLDSALETLSSSTNALNYWAANGTNIYNKNTGNVGIGTTAPQQKLDVRGYIQIGVDGESGKIGGINFKRTTYGGTNNSASIDFWRGGSGGEGILAFSTRQNDADVAPVERMRIDNFGNVGIGTTNPVGKLDVVGSLATFRIETTGDTFSWVGNGTKYIKSGSGNGLIFQANDGSRNDVIISPSGNVGIGNPSPGYKLDVNGEANFGIGTTTNRLHNVSAPTYGTDAANKNYVDSVIAPAATTTVGLQSGFWTTGAGSSIYNNNTGNVGIGVTDPSQKLVVNGSAQINTNLNVDGPTDASRYINLRYNGTSWPGYASYFAQTGAANIAGTQGLIINTNIGQAVSNYGINLAIDGGSKLFIQHTGNVGIGTTAPNNNLEVRGASGLRISDPANIYRGILIFGNLNNGWNSGIRAYDSGDAEMRIWHANASGQIVLATGYNGETTTAMPTDGLFIDQNKVGIGYASPAAATGKLVVNGNVGIGTTSPSASLDIFGNFKITSAGTAYNSNSSYWLRFDETLSGYDSLRVQGDFNTAGVLETAGTVRPNYMMGNLGIGVSTPIGQAEIATTSATVLTNASLASNYNLNLFQTNINSGQGAGLAFTVFSGGNLGSSYTPGAAITFERVGNNSQGGLHFKVKGTAGIADALTDALTIKYDGNVGIGTTNPGAAYKLDVAGNVKATQFCLGTTCVSDWSNPFSTSTILSIGGLNLNNGNITNVNKLTVGTIDPLYRIDGTNYSSFAAAIVGGVKEEYLGRVKISKLNDAKEYEYRLDFSKLSAPSDLWVWRQTVDFSPENIEVSLTPYGAFASTYYIIEDEAIIFRADKPVTVSYRLSGKRVDWQNWPTTAKDQQEKPSFIINKGKVIK